MCHNHDTITMQVRSGGLAYYSGTEVCEDALHRPYDHTVWLEPGSVLVSERDSLYEYLHGLEESAENVCDDCVLNYHHLVCKFKHGQVVPRQTRASIVLWTNKATR